MSDLSLKILKCYKQTESFLIYLLCSNFSTCLY